MQDCDNEFIPALSSRDSTQQQKFSNRKGGSVKIYFDILAKQENILAIQNSKVIGFMSFIYNYGNNDKFKMKNPNDINNYITTTIVNKKFRRHGIATLLYNFIENNLSKSVRPNYISTRTWHTNFQHLELLKKRGYENTLTIKNDRPSPNGELLDTVYYGKRV